MLLNWPENEKSRWSVPHKVKIKVDENLLEEAADILAEEKGIEADYLKGETIISTEAIEDKELISVDLPGRNR